MEKDLTEYQIKSMSEKFNENYVKSKISKYDFIFLKDQQKEHIQYFKLETQHSLKSLLFQVS